MQPPSQTVTEAVILAAGEGTRLRPLTYRRPKVLIHIVNKPFLEHQLQLLKDIGIRRVVLIVGYMREALEEWLLGKSLGIEVETRIQREAKGTGDAINTARGAVGGPFLALNGDVLLDRDSLARMVHATCTSVAAIHVKNPQDYGVFKVEGGYVAKVVEKAEKPPSNLANVGSYVFEADIFDRIDRTPPNPKRNEIEITDTLQSIIDDGFPVRCHEVQEWHELGKPWDVVTLNERLLGRTTHFVHPKSEILGRIDSNVSVGNGTFIGPDVEVLGPSVLGEGCRIDDGAVVGPFCSIGDRSTLSGCRVEGSIVMEDCEVLSGARVGHSVLAPKVSVGRGASINDREEGSKSIMLMIKGVQTCSGRSRLGAVLGDGCMIGEGAVVHAGIMLEPESRVPPRTTVDRSYAG